MTSKLLLVLMPKKKSQMMFQSFVHDYKSSSKGNNVIFLKHFINAMIKNIKI